MNRNEEMKWVLEHTVVKFSDLRKFQLSVLIFIGIIGFIASLAFMDAYVAWQALLINTLFFAGIAHAGLIYSVIFTITDAYWGRSLKRLAEALASFIPFSVILFFLLFLGGKYFFEWYDHDKVIHAKEGWLNYSFFVQRNALSMIFVGILSYLYVKNSVRPDIGLSRELIQGSFKNPLADHFTVNYKSNECEMKKGYFKNRTLAPILGMAYAALSSLIAFDWMMSIDQEWFSTMFGVQYLVSTLMSAGAVLIILAAFFRGKFQLEKYITLNRLHDICKLTFALGLLWTYMIFSQVLIIWYANLPEETPYLMLRLKSKEWGFMFWVIFFILFQIPFWGLMSRTICRSPKWASFFAVDILIGIWLEKYFLVVPSIQENISRAGGYKKDDAALHGWIPGFEFSALIPQLIIAVGMFGLFLYAFIWFLEKIPMMPVSDHRFFSDSH